MSKRFADAVSVAAALDATGGLLDCAIAATGRKQARLAKAVRRKLTALGVHAESAAKSKKATRRISTSCGASIAQLAAIALQDLP